MKYLRLFQTHAAHEQERKSLEKLELYTSYCEDNDEVTIFCKKKSKYAVGDYLLSSGEVIKNADYVDQDVIGVCVIPDNFISKVGVNSKARFCALDETRDKVYSTTGAPGLSMFNTFGCVGEDAEGGWIASNTLTHNATYKGFIPGQASHFNKAVENPYDPGTYWHYDDTKHHIASPYLYVDGEYVFNEGVYNGCVDDTVSMLSDMDGLANTTAINDSEHPAANYCATYSTNGTSAGDWYLPAIGELAFIMPRFDTINEAITKVSGTTFVKDGYWSSTLCSGGQACHIYIEYGRVENKSIDYNDRVRPFLRLN